MPHISAHLSCLSVPLINASQCNLSVLPVSSAYQCAVPPNSASQCRLSVPYECCLSVPISCTYQCLLINAAYQFPSVQPH
ncbi:unnamed protein product [Staurois parvus]|uniref:Secreted protein n=1 Tax=Staurois parvus TaxID=386267 RepID=A0ABN9FN44_9NEOB|nr:unnamed protein product [Staurois parvus]